MKNIIVLIMILLLVGCGNKIPIKDNGSNKVINDVNNIKEQTVVIKRNSVNYKFNNTLNSSFVCIDNTIYMKITSSNLFLEEFGLSSEDGLYSYDLVDENLTKVFNSEVLGLSLVDNNIIFNEMEGYYNNGDILKFDSEKKSQQKKVSIGNFGNVWFLSSYGDSVYFLTGELFENKTLNQLNVKNGVVTELVDESKVIDYQVTDTGIYILWFSDNVYEIILIDSNNKDDFKSMFTSQEKINNFYIINENMVLIQEQGTKYEYSNYYILTDFKEKNVILEDSWIISKNVFNDKLIFIESTDSDSSEFNELHIYDINTRVTDKHATSFVELFVLDDLILANEFVSQDIDGKILKHMKILQNLDELYTNISN